MAASKKASTGTKAGAGAGKGEAKAKETAKDAKARPAAGAAATTKAAPVKLNDRQREFLGKIKEAGESGYQIGAKVEQRTIDALAERKLVKRGAKDKASGQHRYLLTKAAHKHLPDAVPAPAPAEPAPVAPAPQASAATPPAPPAE